MLLYVLCHTEHFLIDPTDPSWPHYLEIAISLLPHGLIGALALTLAFMPFNRRLRARYPRVHRISGRIYVAAVFIVAPLGVYWGISSRRSLTTGRSPPRAAFLPRYGCSRPGWPSASSAQAAWNNIAAG